MRKYFPALGVEIEFPEEILKDLEVNPGISNFEDPFKFKKKFTGNTLFHFASENKDNFSVADVFFILKKINFKSFEKFMFFINHENKEKVLFLFRFNPDHYKIELLDENDTNLYEKDVSIFIKGFVV